MAQRVYGLALGYEDLNDHDQLRRDPLLAVLVEKADPTGKSRARRARRGQGAGGQEHAEPAGVDGGGGARRRSATRRSGWILRRWTGCWWRYFCRRTAKPPEQIILDLDSTDDPLHGNQEGRFFHGYYGHYCYLPLYIFCGEHLLCARLRPANIDGAAGSVEELDRLVQQIRQAWPEVRIIVRGDSGFCREELMAGARRTRWITSWGWRRMSGCRRRSRRSWRRRPSNISSTGQAARVFREFTLSDAGELVASAAGGGQGRTSGEGRQSALCGDLAGERRSGRRRRLYEELYCARGEMENRIKEQMMLFADRTSTAYLRSNQIRLYFSSVAYVLMQALRRLGLQGTEWAQAQCTTLRLKLLKIGALIRITVRKVWVSMAGGYPYAERFRQVYAQLQAVPLRA